MWQTISVRETCERLKTNSVNGLTKDEAEERINTNNCSCNICCDVICGRF